MKWLDLLHRWTGGIVGLVLAILGLTGAILIHKDDWIGLPHSGDALATDPSVVAAATDRLLAADPGASGIIYASEHFGLHHVRHLDGSGAYATQAGDVVTQWSSQWQRPELWLFDLHHHLFAGEIGEMVIGLVGLCALLFVVSGVILWWRTRRTFAFRLWPKRMSRPAIVLQHRDLGVVAAPLLFLSALTGTMMIFRPVAAIVVAPFTPPAQVVAAISPPKVTGGTLSPSPDWAAMFTEARRRFPDASFRVLTMPKKSGHPIGLRLKRAAEWLPNGRTAIWFDAATGVVLESRDALAMPAGAQVFNAAYPVHSAKIGGLAYRLLMTCSGLALALLGTLAVWTFWFKRPRTTRIKSRPPASPAGPPHLHRG